MESSSTITCSLKRRASLRGILSLAPTVARLPLRRFTKSILQYNGRSEKPGRGVIPGVGVALHICLIVDCGQYRLGVSSHLTERRTIVAFVDKWVIRDMG